ncbi:MAG: acyltransferase [Bacteroidales bacterium]|nr:acyltransferase [Bacteroidales bacterium]MCM1147744.1 acyltransferase [Bacteroidales bacterium]MCM1206646.1 acyltransferase [Bacillota bacterium]
MHNEFDEIRPFGKGEVRPAVESLLRDRQFMAMLRGFLPLPKGIIRFLIRTMFIGVNTTLDFQKRYMRRIVGIMLSKSTDDCTFNGHPLPVKNRHHTYVSNHRDIVLDSAILSYELFKNGYDTTVEIGIGDNLLIYPWIRTLVKLNKAFTVKRGLSPRQLLESSQLMSRYIHHAIKDKGENIWLAQREGRAKDSDDRTQESVLKMLSYGGSLNELNIIPLTISYEFDPCDYLKAKEFQLKRDNPGYKKSKQDDLENMKVGIMGYKGRVHYECAPCINEWLDEYDGLTKADFYMEVARRMDNAIHLGYRIYPNNYIALDLLNGNRDNDDFYTPADEKKFEDYLKGQLAKIDIPGKDEAFLRERMLTMYANPLINKMASKNEDDGA